MNNKDIAKAYATRAKNSASGSNFYFEGAVLYSYGPHFPVAVIRGSRAFFNSDGYSPTTGRHKSLARSALQDAGFTITPRTTAEMREIVSNECR